LKEQYKILGQPKQNFTLLSLL